MKKLIQIFCLFLALIIATSGAAQAQSLILDGDVLLDNPNEKFKKLKSTSPYKKIQKDNQKDNLPPLKAKKDVKIVQQEEIKENIKDGIKGKTSIFHGNTEIGDTDDIDAKEAPYRESIIKIAFYLFASWITASFS